MTKSALVILFSIHSLCLFGQGKEFFPLEYKNKQYFKESSTFFKDSGWRFNQTVSYDNPNSLDEEYWSRLVFEIFDTISFMKSKIIRIPNDELRIDYKLDTWGVFFFQFPPTDSTSFSGTITFCHSTNENVLMSLDIEILNFRTSDRYFFKGDRVFRRTNSVDEFYKH